MSSMAYKIISKKIKYKGSWANMEVAKIKLPTGNIVEWESIITSDAVAIVAVDKDKNIYLSKEWRVAWGKELLQIPAGMCGGKTGKAFLKQARNELREEIGFDAKKWEKLISFSFSGRQNTIFHIFLAQDLYKSPKKPDENEIIEVVKMPFKKACDIFLSGKILTTSYTLIGIALTKNKLKL